MEVLVAERVGENLRLNIVSSTGSLLQGGHRGFGLYNGVSGVKISHEIFRFHFSLIVAVFFFFQINNINYLSFSICFRL